MVFVCVVHSHCSSIHLRLWNVLGTEVSDYPLSIIIFYRYFCPFLYGLALVFCQHSLEIFDLIVIPP